jgi:hypothetical protein
MKYLFLIMFSFLVGCATTIDNHTLPSADWPKVIVVENQVSVGVLYQQCWKYVPEWMKWLGAIVEGCAEIDFKKNVCTIWVRGDGFANEEILTHERKHCQGYDHIGDSILRDEWEDYKRELH